MCAVNTHNNRRACNVVRHDAECKCRWETINSQTDRKQHRRYALPQTANHLQHIILICLPTDWFEVVFYVPFDTRLFLRYYSEPVFWLAENKVIGLICYHFVVHLLQTRPTKLSVWDSGSIFTATSNGMDYLQSISPSHFHLHRFTEADSDWCIMQSSPIMNDSFMS